MVGQVLDLDNLIGGKDQKAVFISNKYVEWEMYRNEWMVGRAELRNYLFATDTTKTTNKKLPWKNSTTVPKLTQIRDNLHANYMAALFPTSNWLTWEGDREEDEGEKKRGAIEAYMRTKARQDNYQTHVSKLVLDWIDTGNVFATMEWADDSLELNGVTTRGYVGPRIVRISPNDILFNPTAVSFEKSPKIIRSVMTLGELTKKAKNMPNNSIQKQLLNRALDKTTGIRKTVRSLSQGDVFKGQGYQIDGFTDIQNYYQSDYVEVLTFYGDLYDIESNQLYEHHQVTIIDRCWVVDERTIPNWTTNDGIFHCGWRLRPDNLYAMGPLDNLVGMQYRIDHLENLKADVFDTIAYPVFKIKGYVEDFDYGPGERIIVGDDGDVEFMHPDPTALNADTQIQELERRMEEMAGAPREAMGIRSPGEKTKFEVQLLDNAASRIFLNKITHFERDFFEKLLNFGLATARQNMSSGDVVRTLDSDIDAVIFSTITQDDITANGILRPEGASHFAQKANTLQNLNVIMNSAMAKDPAIAVHWSGKKIAKMVSELDEWDQYKIFGENIRVIEMEETKRLQAASGEQTDIQANTPPGLTEGDPASVQAQPPMVPGKPPGR